jgi:hypothetical protein
MSGSPTAGSTRRRTHAALTIAGCCCAMPGALGACAALAAPARAETSATVTPLLSPDRAGARGTLSLAVHFAGSDVPTPVRRSILRFPTGLTLEMPQLRSCSASRLRASGARGCPAASALGRGEALIEAPLGSQTIPESISLWLFLGPLRNLQPTVELLGQGYTPIEERIVLTGTMQPAGGAYGEALTLSIPLIPTLTLEPDASIATFSLVIGGRAARTANTLRLPASCPRGGFPFAAEFSYADGSASDASATVPCPR